MEGMTPAQRMAASHAAAESHQPTIEDTIDENDLPASKADAGEEQQVVNTPVPAPANATPMSAKAAGKQKAQPAPAAKSGGQSRPISSTKAPLDTTSEELFPSLAAPKGTQPTAPGSMWGARPSFLKSPPNGQSQASPGSPTPSNTSRPGTAHGSAAVPANRTQQVSLPGRHTDSAVIPTSRIKQRGDLKRPIPDVVRDVNRKSMAKVEFSSIAGGVKFSAQGPSAESVHQALRDVVAQVGQKISLKVPVPASLIAQIIGKGGSKIQDIQKRSGARVQVPRSGTRTAGGDEDSEEIEVEILGDPITVELARRDIQLIADEHTSQVSAKIKHVAPELFPFISGAHDTGIEMLRGGRDVSISVPEYHTWRDQPPQVPDGNQRAIFAPRDGYHIQVSGDREAARAVQEEIERLATEFENRLTMQNLDIERERHKFILGQQGNSLNDFIEETGCAIIMPPPHSDTERITIVGPPDQIENAINKVMDLALSMQMLSVDVSRQHASAPRGSHAHALDVARYFQQRKALEQFEQLHDASVVIPPSVGGNSPSWQVYSRDGRNAMKARAEITRLVGAHPPTRFRSLNMHPYYQRHIQDRHAQAIRDDHGVHLVFADPEDNETASPMLLVYEGKEPPHSYSVPRSEPSAEQIAQFQAALAEAEARLTQLVGNEGEIISKTIDTPAKYRDKLHRYASREPERNPDVQFPVQFLGFQPPASKSADTVPMRFRGPVTNVDEFEQRLLAHIEEQIRDEAERGYTTTCEFPQKFNNLLIGRRGENINKLREEFDVEIQLGEGQVEIKGPKAKADAAKAHIIAFAKKQEDETTHILKIKPQFHGELIGAKGALVTKLQDKYNVRIQFPSSSASGAPEATGDSENGAAVRPRRAQAADEVIIKGPRRGADEARDEILGLYQYTQDTSHTASISVAQSQLPSLIGREGRELDNLRLETGAQIDIPREAVGATGRVDVIVKGTKAQVDLARKVIAERAKVFDQTVKQEVQIHKKHHRAMIGRDGENIRQMVLDAGGPSEARERARLVRFPQQDADDDKIRLEGPGDVIQKLAVAMQAFADKRDQLVTETISVPPERHGALIGRRGDTRREIETEFSVTIMIPAQNVEGPARSAVKISGLPADVEHAKEKVLSIVKTPEGQTVMVPRRLHHAVADSQNGNFFRNLSRTLKVTVDHAGQAKPPRPRTAAARANGTLSSPSSSGLPLITDAAVDPSQLNVEDHHTWELTTGPATIEGEDADATIPWVLKGGEAENVAQAKEMLLAALEDAKQSCTGLLVLPDPKMYRHVIGRGGSTVDKIRADTGCQIMVPKSGSEKEAIEIRGSQAAVEEARDMILEAVSSAAGRR